MPSLVRISSRILLMTTKQSKRLNSDTKYPWNEQKGQLSNMELANHYHVLT